MLLLEYDNVYWKRDHEMFNLLLDLVRKFPDNGKYINRLNSCKYKKSALATPQLTKLRKWIDDQLEPFKDDILNLTAGVYWILNGLTSCPICSRHGCGKKLSSAKFDVRKDVPIQYCSAKCFRLDAKTNAIKISVAAKRNKERDPDFFKKAEQKKKAGKIKRGHDPNWNNSEKNAQTRKKKKQEDPLYQERINEKISQTKVANGHSPTWNNKQQAVKTRYQKNGGVWESPETIFRKEQTSYNKYGTRSPNQSPIVKQHKKEACLAKFGVDSYSKTQLYHDQMIAANEQRKLREYDTKKKNGSFNSSRQEDEVYELLKTVFRTDDIERQYRSDKYPFNCDFYIKSLDLYIEANFFWHHQDHFFDINSDEDLKIVEKWRRNISKQYRIAEKVWTCTDLKKAQTAIENSLHYIVFWNINEVKCWVKTKSLTRAK